MSLITISFDREWLNQRRSEGVRVVRTLEKWANEDEGVALKSSSANSITLEMKPSYREDFVTRLKARLCELGEDEKLSHTTFSGDIVGFELPTSSSDEKSSSEKSSSNESDERQTKVASAKNTSNEITPDEIEPELDPQKTLEEICAKIPIRHSKKLETYVRELAAVIPTLQKMGVEQTLWHQHLLLAVEAGYGRSEFLASLVKLFKSFDVIKGELDSKTVREFILLPPGQESSADGYCMPWDAVLDAAKDMQRANAKHGITRAILYIDISAWLSQLGTSEWKRSLRRLNALCGSFLVVFRVPFLEGHVLRDAADALNDILNVRTISVTPAPISDMTDYAREVLDENSFKLSEDATAVFEQWVLREKGDDSFFGYKTVDKMVQRLIFEKALANCRKGSIERVVSREDLIPFTSASSTDETGRAELNQLVGMKDIAHRLDEVIAQIKLQQKLASNGRKVARPAIHMLFTGNPGTGKTTVARILARMMKEAGILRKGHLVEIKGRDLCGRYIGETAPKTCAICRDAYGSVLFIDEAYSLFRDEYDSARDYGREALDTLVAEMENHRDDFCVVMAGYKDEMTAMLKGNAGLRSRIPYEIEFPNYTREELEEIFFSMLKGNFEYEDGFKDALREFLAEMPDPVFESKEFSNARFIRNLYERTWGKAAYRNSLNGGALRLLKSDFVGAASDKEFENLLKKNVERRRIGF